MYLQNISTSLQIGQFYGDAAVKTSGTEQGFVQGFGTVCCRKDYNAFLPRVYHPEPVESDGFVQPYTDSPLDDESVGETVQRLFACIGAAHAVAIAPLTNGVNFVNENNAGSFFVCLLEQVAHLCRAHADEHFHKFGAGDREKRHFRLTGNRLRQQGFACSRRADKQRTLWHCGADFGIFFRVMQEIHNFPQGFFRFVLPCNIGKGFAGLCLDIDFGVGFAESHSVAAHTAHACHHFTHNEPPEQEEYDKHDETADPG